MKVTTPGAGLLLGLSYHPTITRQAQQPKFPSFRASTAVAGFLTTFLLLLVIPNNTVAQGTDHGCDLGITSEFAECHDAQGHSHFFGAIATVIGSITKLR